MSALLPRVIQKMSVTPFGCWDWTAYRDKDGYGSVKADGKMQLAHRHVYSVLVGPIPKGLTLDHLCRNRACVNPEHLEPVTQRVNTHRGNTAAARNAAKTHCVKGHPYDEANTYRNRKGRFCRACGRDATRRYLQRKRQEATP